MLFIQRSTYECFHRGIYCFERLPCQGQSDQLKLKMTSGTTWQNVSVKNNYAICKINWADFSFRTESHKQGLPEVASATVIVRRLTQTFNSLDLQSVQQPNNLWMKCRLYSVWPKNIFFLFRLCSASNWEKPIVIIWQRLTDHIKERYHEKQAAVLLDFVQITLPLILTTCTTFFRRQNSRFESMFRTRNTISVI